MPAVEDEESLPHFRQVEAESLQPFGRFCNPLSPAVAVSKERARIEWNGSFPHLHAINEWVELLCRVFGNDE